MALLAWAFFRFVFAASFITPAEADQYGAGCIILAAAPYTAAGELFDVESAGTRASFVRSEAIGAMHEVEIDISGQRSKSVIEFDRRRFDYVITVCDNARETCPVFFGAAEKLHHSFEDPPAPMVSTDEERMTVFRRVRDELRAYLRNFAETRGAQTLDARQSALDNGRQ
jgi:arsenate reductase